MARSLLLHGVTLGFATCLALVVWTRDKKAPANLGDVTIWNARPSDIEHMMFESKGKVVRLDAHKDALGTWFSGIADVAGRESPDAGSSQPTKKTALLSVTAANKLAEVMAPLRGLRELGKVGEARAAEFGLKEPDGSLSVTIAGTEHKLILGGRTPGGADRYVRDPGSTVVYVIKGDVTRDLEAGETTLVEREVHDFKDPDIESVRIGARGKTREVLRRGPDSKRIWSDPSAPDTGDETVSNWIAKVDRLRPLEYPTPQPKSPEVVVRIDYTVKGQKGMFLEVGKAPGASQADAGASPTKLDYLLRTERTRQWAKVTSSLAEQVEQDLASILK